MTVLRNTSNFSLPLALLAATAILGGEAVSAAAAQDEGMSRPKFNFLRWKEDWSSFEGAGSSDFRDSIKHVSLNDDGSNWASFGGRARLRIEDWSNFAFGAPAVNDDTFALWRFFLHGDFHFGENIRVFAELKHADASQRDLPGGKRAALDVDQMELQQAFVDITIPLENGKSLVIRPGRQELLFGKQRLVSPLPWGNNLRHWDGVSVMFEMGGWKMHGFWTQFAPSQKYEFNTADSGQEFFGVYATGKMPGADHINMDAYFLGLKKDAAAVGAGFNGTAGAEDRFTLGSRLHGKVSDTGFDYEVEAAYQFGEVGTGDIAAYMIASQFGYTPADMTWSPRFFLGFDLASGDDTAGGDVETFNQLFPLGHAYLGYIDIVGRQNVMDISLGATFKPMAKMTAGITAHFFTRESDQDAFYNAGGGVVRAGAAGTSDDIGTEIDFTIKYKFDAHSAALFGYSHFSAGDFITESGASLDTDFIYAQYQYTF